LELKYNKEYKIRKKIYNKMTTEYDSREAAIEMGFYHIGFVDETLRKEAMSRLPEAVQRQLEWPHSKTIETYDIKTPKGEDARIGVGKFRDGFDLWLINPKTGFCMRE
jgi:hypothetical protein